MTRRILAGIVLTVFLFGCMSIIEPIEQVEHQPTVGQELIDLKKAMDEGAITENEFVELKQKIIESEK